MAHEYGLGRHYDAELQATDRLVADMAAVLPPGAVLLVTADHGQVDVPVTLPLAPRSSGSPACREGRFRWLHAAGREAELLAATTAHESGWVVPVQQVLDEGAGPR